MAICMVTFEWEGTLFVVRRGAGGAEYRDTNFLTGAWLSVSKALRRRNSYHAFQDKLRRAAEALD